MRRVGVNRREGVFVAGIIDFGFRMVKNFAAYRFKGIGRSHFDTFGTSGPLKGNEGDAGSLSRSRPIAIIEGQIVIATPTIVIKRDRGAKGRRRNRHRRSRTAHAYRRTVPPSGNIKIIPRGIHRGIDIDAGLILVDFNGPPRGLPGIGGIFHPVAAIVDFHIIRARRNQKRGTAGKLGAFH